MKKALLKDYFENLQELNPELKKFKLHNADARLGRRVALVETYEHGTIQAKTSYMTYKEMYEWLNGYVYAKNIFNK